MKSLLRLVALFVSLLSLSCRGTVDGGFYFGDIYILENDVWTLANNITIRFPVDKSECIVSTLSLGKSGISVQEVSNPALNVNSVDDRTLCEEELQGVEFRSNVGWFPQTEDGKPHIQSIRVSFNDSGWRGTASFTIVAHYHNGQAAKMKIIR